MVEEMKIILPHGKDTFPEAFTSLANLTRDPNFLNGKISYTEFELYSATDGVMITNLYQSLTP